METLDAYAPPKSLVTEIELAPPKVPLTFKIMLIAVLAIVLLGIFASAGKGGIVWLGVMSIASWKTLQGSRAASRVLGVLLALNAVLTVVAGVAAFQHNRFAGGFTLAVAVCMGVLAAYIFFSPAMQAVFRKADKKKWSGG